MDTNKIKLNDDFVGIYKEIGLPGQQSGGKGECITGHQPFCR